MQRVADLTSEPIVGQFYLVPCVKLKVGNEITNGTILLDGKNWKHGTTNVAPVLPDVHLDHEDHGPKIGRHIHVDPRFIFDYHRMGVIVGEDQIESGDFQEVAMMCRRRMPDWNKFPLPTLQEKYKKSKINCNRCPHQGTYLGNCPTDGRVIVCPAHGLKFDAETGEATDKSREPIPIGGVVPLDRRQKIFLSDGKCSDGEPLPGQGKPSCWC